MASPNQTIERWPAVLDSMAGDGLGGVLSKPERYSRLRLGTVIALGALALGSGLASASSQESQGELVGSQVQVFNVIASDNPQTAVDPNIKSYLRGVQNYLRTRGEGLRMRITQDEDGNYSIPLIKLDMTQEEIDAEPGYKEEWRNLETKLDQLGYDAKDKIGLAYINNTGRCVGIAGALPNPKRIAFVNSHPGCSTGNSKRGYSFRDVKATQAGLYLLGIDYVPEPTDTMAYASLQPYWNWDETWLDRDGKYYKARLMASRSFQHHVVVKAVGNGNVTTSPKPDACQVDCGEGLLYAGGTKATLTAKPEAEAKFVGWQNCPPDGEGKSQTGNSCELSVVQDYAIGAQFETVVPPPKISTLVARVIKNKKLGSKIEKFDGNGTIVFAGKEGKTRTYTTNKIGQLVMLRLKPAEGSFISYIEGCDRPPAHKGNPTNTKRCFVYMRKVDDPKTAEKEVELVEVGFKKTQPKPEK